MGFVTDDTLQLGGSIDVGGKTVGVYVEVKGIKETLRELNKLAPDLRRQITREYKAITESMVADAKNETPQKPPLSGMGRKWHGTWWQEPKVDKNITVKIDTRRARKRNLEKGIQYETLSAFVFHSRDKYGIIFDIVGRKGGEDRNFQNRTYRGQTYRYQWNNTLIKNLNANWGRASRYMWPTAEKHQADMESKIGQLVLSIEDKLTEAIARQGNI